MIAADLLQILRCPETHQALNVAPAELVGRLNARITEGNLRNRAGQPVAKRIDSGLVRADGQALYLVRANIPVMLVDEAIPLG